MIKFLEDIQISPGNLKIFSYRDKENLLFFHFQKIHCIAALKKNLNWLEIAQNMEFLLEMRIYQ